RQPALQPLRDEVRALLVVMPIEDARVGCFGAEVDARSARFQLLTVRACDPVTGGAVCRFQPDLARALKLRRVGVQRSLPSPVVEDARGVVALLHRFTPVTGGQAAVLLPGSAGELESAASHARDLEKADGGRLLSSPLRQGELPPHALDPGKPALVLDRIA